MDQNTSSSYGIKTQLSLASLMFFGPFIKHFLNENEGFELNDEDKSFVKGYMLLGSINLIFAAICIFVGIGSKFFDYQWINTLFTVFSSVLLLILFGGSIAIFANISINNGKDTNLTQSISKDLMNNGNSIRDYIPFINIYTWYSLHDFDGDHRILKESLLIWTLFGLLCFIGNIWVISLAMIIIIVRIVTLSVIGDIMSQKRHDMINMVFHKNIEEIWGWCMGWLSGHIGNIFGAKIVILEKQKELQTSYAYLYDLKKYGTIQIQYILLLLVTGYILKSMSIGNGFGLVILGTSLLWGRYILMGIIWGHLPPLPVIHDIFRAIGSLSQKKSIPTK